MIPPADAKIPQPPQGFVPTNGSDYFGLAVKADQQVGYTFVGLRRLLNAASDIAHRAVATKREKKRKKAEEDAAAKGTEGGGEGGSRKE